MGINLKKWLPSVANIAFRLLGQVDTIEAIAEAVGSLKGDDKRKAAVTVALKGVTLAEAMTDKDLLNDPEVAAAAGALVDAYVAFQNILASKKAA